MSEILLFCTCTFRFSYCVSNADSLFLSTMNNATR